MPQRDALIQSGVAGSVEPMADTPTTTRELLTYDDIARLSGLKVETLCSYQSRARRRREAGRARRTDMPAPVGTIPNQSSHARRRDYQTKKPGLAYQPVFDGEQVRTWIGWAVKNPPE